MPAPALTVVIVDAAAVAVAEQDSSVRWFVLDGQLVWLDRMEWPELHYGTEAEAVGEDFDEDAHSG